MAGLRVLRGPDWKWEAEDGGEGHVGTVTKQRDDGWVEVIWDDGREKKYRNRANDRHDLRVLDNGPAGIRHPGISCDSCSEKSIFGMRWKCLECHKYDLCTVCYGNDKHDIDHAFHRIDKPSAIPQGVGKRKMSVKLQARGVYTGATVKRGQDWTMGNQDGGEGRVGKVTKVGYKQLGDDYIHSVEVEWSHATTRYIYDFGRNGRVYVKCALAAIGWGYYRDHLPPLGDTAMLVKNETDESDSSSDTSDEDETASGFTRLLTVLAHAATAGGVGPSSRKEATMRKFKPGDRVRLHENLSTVRRLQVGHGGFNMFMIAMLGKVGIVKRIDDDGDLIVVFDIFEMCLNPALVTNVTQTVLWSISVTTTPSRSNTSDTRDVSGDAASKHGFKVGDIVKLDKDVDFVQRSQEGHGGWTDAMRKSMLQDGTVTAITAEGDIKADFGGNVWTLNPAVCHLAKSPVSGAEAMATPPQTKRNTDSKAGATEYQPGFKRGNEQFSVGDQIKLDATPDMLRVVQRGHGGWYREMPNAIGKIGIINKITTDGDLEVKFAEGTWTLNPKVCTSMDPASFKEHLPGADDIEGENTINFRVGDQVTIGLDVELVVRFQKGHGGWNADMATALGNVGTVQEIRSDGDLRVAFGTKRWTFNPAILTLQESGQVGERGKNTNTDTSKVSGDSQYICSLCRDRGINIVFNCGHFTCDTCSKSMDKCHACRKPIAMRTQLFV